MAIHLLLHALTNTINDQGPDVVRLTGDGSSGLLELPNAARDPGLRDRGFLIGVGACYCAEYIRKAGITGVATPTLRSPIAGIVAGKNRAFSPFWARAIRRQPVNDWGLGLSSRDLRDTRGDYVGLGWGPSVCADPIGAFIGAG